MHGQVHVCIHVHGLVHVCVHGEVHSTYICASAMLMYILIFIIFNLHAVHIQMDIHVYNNMNTSYLHYIYMNVDMR